MLSPLIGIIASSGVAASTSSYESIASSTVGSGGTSSVTFSSIPGTFTHLQIRGIFRPTATSWVLAQFNGDTATNYSHHDLRGNGSTVSVEAVALAQHVYCILGVSTAANTFAAGVVDILDYANTNKYKTTRHFNGIDTNGAGNIDLTSGFWRNTAAITSITLSLSTGGTIPQYSQFALYGIKG